jgi:hypothetical protein
MCVRRTAGPSALASVLAVIALALAADGAAAGEFSVANCQADPLNYSTRAFEDFATRGMMIKRACDPDGPGLRGLITSNVVRRGRVPRGAVALATISAPAGTRFTSFRWAGTARRRDCRYALQLYAEAPDIQPIAIKNVRANRACPRPARAQIAGYRSRNFNVMGATRIVQRVICVGGDGRKSCSAQGSNYLRTYEAEVRIADVVAPSAAILSDTPLGRGEWVGGTQQLTYDASDNVGVRTAAALATGVAGGSTQRPCSFAVPERTFADRVPCPNGPGHLEVDTRRFTEGTQGLVVQAQDTAGNVGISPAVTARIDNTPPARVDVEVEGGEAWRNRNDFMVTWTNPLEADRAPIVAASYKLCSAGTDSCTRGQQSGESVSRFGVAAPAPGAWSISLWRRDAAGNETETAASVPVTLRYDPEPPQLAFEPPAPADPTLVSVAVTDRVSGVASGSIEISPSGSGIWQTLATDLTGGHLLTLIDDAALPAGTYVLRARAADLASNEASTDRRLDGQAIILTLPVRIVSTMKAGFERIRWVRQTVRRHGKRVRVRRRITVLTPAARVSSGGRAQIAGRLTNRDGQGIPDQEVRVYSSSVVSADQVVAVLRTDSDGRYRYTATGAMNRTLRFAFVGSALVLPAQASVEMRVPGLTSLGVSRRLALNGQAVTFSGSLRTLPAPAGGKLVELQVRLSSRWQTFRTVRTDAAGRWAIAYRFRRTRGVQRYRFRARLPKEADYPFAAGGSRSLTVRVSGV